MLGFVERQIEQAAQDSKVKAVVLRINSPGGSITASDDLYQRLVQLRDGDGERDRPSRPMVVSMGSLAASGGYYIAVPGQVLYAERSSITGSIGVFAAFPNLTGLAQKVGVDLEVVARGALKRAGSPFHQMKPEERAMWEDLVEHGYRQFKQVIENNRPALKGKLEEPVVNEMRTATGPKTEATLGQKFHYVRRRADGGIFTADQARTLGLIDKLGYLEDAIKEARDLAQLTEYQAFTYEKPFNISELLLGSKAVPPNLALDPSCLAEGALPRLWYLAPQSELAGVLQACSRRE
jgi:protease-4